MAGRPARARHHFWMILCLAPLGFGAWVPLVAGLRARRPLWVALGIVFCALTVAGWVLATVVPHEEDASFAGILILIPWVAAAVMTAAIYPSYRRRRALLEDVEEREEGSARRRLEREQDFAEREATSST